MTESGLKTLISGAGKMGTRTEVIASAVIIFTLVGTLRVPKTGDDATIAETLNNGHKYAPMSAVSSVVEKITLSLPNMEYLE